MHHRNRCHHIDKAPNIKKNNPINQKQKPIPKSPNTKQIKSTATLIKQHLHHQNHYSKTEFAEYLINKIISDNLLTKVGKTARLTLYSISAAGLKALEAPPVTPLEVAAPRTIAFQKWDGRMQWDVASQRGDHRHIGRVGVMC